MTSPAAARVRVPYEGPPVPWIHFTLIGIVLLLTLAYRLFVIPNTTHPDAYSAFFFAGYLVALLIIPVTRRFRLPVRVFHIPGDHTLVVQVGFRKTSFSLNEFVGADLEELPEDDPGISKNRVVLVDRRDRYHVLPGTVQTGYFRNDKFRKELCAVLGVVAMPLDRSIPPASRSIPSRR